MAAIAPRRKLADKKETAVNAVIVEHFRGVHPAHVYPACPDQSDKFKRFDLLLDARKMGINLTESGTMTPAASVSGLYFSSTAQCFNVSGSGAIS